MPEYLWPVVGFGAMAGVVGLFVLALLLRHVLAVVGFLGFIVGLPSLIGWALMNMDSEAPPPTWILITGGGGILLLVIAAAFEDPL